MARLQRLSADEFDPELATKIGAEGKPPIELAVLSIIGQRPDLTMPLVDYTRALKKGQLPRRLVELVRLRIAFHNQCRSCMAIRYPDALEDGLTEELVCSLEQPMEAEGMTQAEKVAVTYADLFATNHLAISDETYAELGEHFTQGQIIELGLHVALFVGMGRLAATWHIVEDLPEVFRETQIGEVLTPWNNESVTVGLT